MPRRPNVVFLMTDHANAAALAVGSQCLTPNLDALASEGVRFGRCYTPNAICSPARASLMTGTYPSTHGMWDCTHTQRAEWVNVDERLGHFSQRLAGAGYACGYFGKWHVEQTERMADFGWCESDIEIPEALIERLAGTEIAVSTEGYRDHVLSATGRDDGDDPPRHPAFEKGIDFIGRHAGSAEPFCCFISALEPHDVYVPPKRFLDMYDVASLDVSPTLRHEPADEPQVVTRMRTIWAELTDDQWRGVSAAYWAVITYIDHEVGRVVQALKDAGVYEDTIIVFTSDHGDMLGGHGLATKGIGTAYEEVYNIPLIIRGGPAVGGADDDTTMTSLVDLGPTLLDLCGADPLAGAQGRSLRPVLEGRADAGEWQDAYAEFFGQRFVYTQRITWYDGWKYVFSPGGIDELYNLAADPHERANLAADPASRPVLIDMCKRMWRKMELIGDQSLFRTHYGTLRTAPVGPLSIREEGRN